MSTFKMPFIPGQVNMDFMSMSLNATHPGSGVSEYDVHSLFGLAEGKATREILLNKTISPFDDKRTFLLSRSTFAGSGAYVQHWLGDNHRTWDDMRYSIAGTMNFNMFGIPMVGPDTCGFFDMGRDDNEEICGRWIQLATFFPFARQHRDQYIGGAPNEPWRLSEPYKSWASNALYDRLTYNRMMYTCLFEASISGETCFDPLFFHFPEMMDTDFDMEGNFIAGNAVKVSPVLQPGVTQIDAFFPNGRWVSLTNFTDIVDSNSETGGTKVSLQVNNELNATVAKHLMPGKLIPFQDNSDHSKMLTGQLLNSVNNTMQIVANRDHAGHSDGKVFLDNGESLSELDDATYEFYEFNLNGKTLSKWVLNEGAKVSNGFNLATLVITDAEDLMATDFACWTSMVDRAVTVLTPTYDADRKSLNISMGNGGVDFFNLKDVHFGTTGMDLNLCDGSQYYRTKDGLLPDLTANNVSVVLESMTPHASRDLTLNLTMLSNGAINLHWTYQNFTDVKTPFEVPQDIIMLNRTVTNTTGILSDFVTITQAVDQPMSLVVNSRNGSPVWTLNGMQLGEHINVIDAKAHTTPTDFRGVLGLAEEVSTDLFLKDGVYSLWARDQPDPVQTGALPATNMYGTHPFIMGKATDATWFGVFYNLAAAQDWWLTNEVVTGDVSLKTIATGGVGDISIIV